MKKLAVLILMLITSVGTITLVNAEEPTTIVPTTEEPTTTVPVTTEEPTTEEELIVDDNSGSGEEEGTLSFLDPTLLTNIFNILLVIVGVFVMVKQRTRIIMDMLQKGKTDEELTKKDAIIAEQASEIEMVGHAMINMSDTLNLIVQASKMSPQDKALIGENAIKTKQKVEGFIKNKKERLEKLSKTLKEVKKDPSDALEALSEMGGSILENYANKTDKQ